MPRPNLRILAIAFAGIVCSSPGVAASSMCQRISFEGEVREQQSFRTDIGMGLSFRLEPSGDESGWQFEIGPTQPKKDEWDTYIYSVTPPWRGRHTSMLDTSYATPAQQAVSTGPHEFWFLLRPVDAKSAKAALDDILWPKTDSAQQQALSKLGRLPMGTGALTVLDADIEPGNATSASPSEHEAYGLIHRISFRVELTVPKSFSTARHAVEKSVPCPASSVWTRQWD